MDLTTFSGTLRYESVAQFNSLSSSIRKVRLELLDRRCCQESCWLCLEEGPCVRQAAGARYLMLMQRQLVPATLASHASSTTQSIRTGRVMKAACSTSTSFSVFELRLVEDPSKDEP